MCAEELVSRLKTETLEVLLQCIAPCDQQVKALPLYQKAIDAGIDILDTSIIT